jgi:hypothetical protein
MRIAPFAIPRTRAPRKTSSAEEGDAVTISTVRNAASTAKTTARIRSSMPSSATRARLSRKRPSPIRRSS